MSIDRVRDGHRLAQLLASELTSGATPDALAVSDADPDIEPTTAGTLAYRVRDTAADTHIATVFVHPKRVRVEFRAFPERVAATADEAALRVRQKAAVAPQTVVFIEDGAEVKRVLPAFEVALEDDSTQ